MQFLCFKFAFILFTVALLSGKSVASECTQQDLEARQLLDKMSRSLREKNYRGVFTYEHGAQMQSLSIDHQVNDGVEYEQLIHLDGQLRRVVRKDHPLNCIHPGHRLVRFSDHVSDEKGCGLSDFYRVSVENGQRIAGRESVQLRVIPRDMYRYGYQFSVDKDSALLLKSQVMGQKGQVLERFKFSTLDVNNDVKTGLNQSGNKHIAHHPQMEHLVDSGNYGAWMISWIPPGFTLTSAPASSDLSAYTYTDGLAVFSVIVEPLDKTVTTEDGEGRAQQGATVAYTRAINIDSRFYLVTVIGEVPLDTAKRVAASIVLRG